MAELTYDKNGNEVRCGDIVEVKGAYFKRHNGLYWVEQDGTNESYCGTGLTMLKICKNGKISKAKYNICFYPIWTCTSDRMKNAIADEHNKENATIEIRHDIDNSYVKDEIKQKIENDKSQIEYWEGRFGADYVSPNRKDLEYFTKALNRLEDANK